MCVRACKSKEGSIPKHRNTHIHQTHLSKHKSLHAHAIHPPQETYHSCAKVIRCTHRNWHAKKESLHPQPKALVKQVQHSHQANQVCLLCVQQIQTHFIIFSKTFFIFPSWHLCAISLSCMFTFTWNLPPTLHSNAKECDSANIHRAQRAAHDKQDSHPHWRSISIGWHLHLCW